MDASGCPAGAHHLVRVGDLTLRLESGVLWAAHPVGRRDPFSSFYLPRCGDGRALWATMLYPDIASTTRLPRDCWAAGAPPGPDGPACASTPGGLRAGRDFFAFGLPGDLTIHDRPARAAASGGDDGLRHLTIRRRMPLGNEELRAPVPSRPDLDGGYPKYRLPRIGEGDEVLGPLLVECWGARWPDPIPPARIPHPQPCQVTFDAPRAGVRVTHRFPRDVYDEPDWQALDLRVREMDRRAHVGRNAAVTRPRSARAGSRRRERDSEAARRRSPRRARGRDRARRSATAPPAGPARRCAVRLGR